MSSTLELLTWGQSIIHVRLSWAWRFLGSSSSREEKTSGGVANKNNCSGFVKAVASKLGVEVPMALNADGIADHVERHWVQARSGSEAALYSSQGDGPARHALPHRGAAARQAAQARRRRFSGGSLTPRRSFRCPQAPPRAGQDPWPVNLWASVNG